MPDIQIQATDNSGQFSAYIAKPATTPAPAIILIQEIFGVNQEMRNKCDELAAQGYIAISPDLFWRLEPGIQLTDKTEAEWAKAFDCFQKFDVDKGIEDLTATLSCARALPECTGKVGTVGYCLGGKLAYLMAARTDVDAAVGYYGVQINELLDEAVNIKKPLLLHIAEQDEYVPAEAQNQIKTGLTGNPHVTIYSYNAQHAFARGQGIHYDETCAHFANQHTAEFLNTNIRQKAAA